MTSFSKPPMVDEIELRHRDPAQAIRHYALGLVDEPSHRNGPIAADLVHLSKPRLPSLLFGLLYQWLWDARLLVHLQDNEEHLTAVALALLNQLGLPTVLLRTGQNRPDTPMPPVRRALRMHPAGPFAAPNVMCTHALGAEDVRT